MVQAFSIPPEEFLKSQGIPVFQVPDPLAFQLTTISTHKTVQRSASKKNRVSPLHLAFNFSKRSNAPEKLQDNKFTREACWENILNSRRCRFGLSLSNAGVSDMHEKAGKGDRDGERSFNLLSLEA